MAASFPSYQDLLYTTAHLRLDFFKKRSLANTWTIGFVSWMAYLQSPETSSLPQISLASTTHPPDPAPPKETIAVSPTKLCVSEMQLNNQLLGECIWVFPGCLPRAFQTSKSPGAGLQGPPPRPSQHPVCHSSQTSEAASAVTSHSFASPILSTRGLERKTIVPPEKGGAGKETRPRQQHLATLWLRARTRSYEIETWKQVLFSFW